jgi:integrase
MATISKITNSKGENRYRVRVVTGHHTDGSAVQKMRTFRTKAEANAEAARWETNLKRGMTSEDNRERFGAFVQKWYVRAGKHVRPSTLAGYRYSLDRHILPAFQGHQLRQLTRTVVQEWIDTLPTPDAAARSRRVLHIVLQEAVNLGMLDINPAGGVKTPPRQPAQSAAWTADEARTFLHAVRGHMYDPYWLLALRLGTRPGELLALRWGAVDLAEGTIEIRESASTFGHCTYAGEPKTAAARRTYDLPEDLVLELTTHRQRQREQGMGWREEDFVCANSDGAQIRYCNLRRAFKDLCKLAKVPAIRLYDLRHTCISLLLANGADLKATSELVGHANVQITRNVYQKTYRDQRAHALGLLSAVLKTEKRDAV